MTNLKDVGIAGTGMYVPERVVKNSWFEEFLDTSDEWIVQRTGIDERRYAADDETTATMCVAAARQACENASLDPADLDAILIGTLTPDYPLPSTACLVQSELGAKNAMAMDLAAACSGFIYGTHLGRALISSGSAKNVLVLGAETLSRVIDFSDRGSCILFGDGAGAAILQPHADCGQGRIVRSELGADGSGFDNIIIPGGGSKRPQSAEVLESHAQFIHLKGREVFRFAVSTMGTLIERMIEGIPREQVSLVVPHQVNKRIIDAAVERIDLPLDRVAVNIERYANTSAATVPIALHEAVAQGRIEKGKYVVTVAFGAGMTWGASLIEW
ncbi:3-oxoacyl-[acyl-carrier-protein] synthase 3 [Planctomycetes bacterium Pla163]|uniref:Beta-ketoacyl-[acyl-carrier-protein] synthase III n=1 Tax=Rohdeia mirabilis TaxID=2528008 RepID=A0A518D0N8_9BACT|nr:3-oxoacyl-[acyl-carrier-protein] synthase 3 [Planctomycetes bacterium Pla163]